MKRLDKKGTDKILSVYWFAILLIVAVGVVMMVANFYGHPYDVRNVEANILANKVIDCLYGDEKLDESLLEDDILKNCNLDFGDDKDEYYFEIGLIKEGNFNLKDACDREDKSVVCVERSFYALDGQGGGYPIKILTAVRKTEQNAK